ncbi:MAG: bifunctional 4-hydroxy-3-methylbut-2-enyl diphosphate reductase/30S ribosomal protein S1 [Clostridia bacterium]|nr:bifunctional 4-hydroxy-3-methylbut-2-enyl diphosphate reductase/30S ribosomal protein S1 [Clostridia bacterium]
MKIVVCKEAGFCYGIRRATELLEKLLEQGKKVCCLGELLHNPDYMRWLTERGVKVVESVEEVPEGYCLLIRSHGVPQEVYDRIAQSGVEYYDATCPSVAKIHRLAASAPADGTLLLAGNEKHPEIMGIVGHCACRCLVFDGQQSLLRLLEEHPELHGSAVLAAAQTTFSMNEWKKCREIIANNFTNAQIFDTICNTTNLRQKEAAETAALVDKMIVIGGRQSSNTAKLREICAQYAQTVWIENAGELRPGDYAGCGTVGVTAGASTPIKNIMEVVHHMNENQTLIETNEGFNFEEALEESFKRLNKQDTIKGIVTAVYPTEVAVDIGRKQAGYIPLNELTSDPNAKTADLVKVGDELELMVLKTNDVEGVVMLSKRRVDASANWAKVVAAKESKEVLTGTVTEVVGNGAGVVLFYENCRVFIPASQTGIPRDGDLTTLLKQQVTFIVIDVEEGRRKRVVGSIRLANSIDRKEATAKFWENAQVGDVYTGRVRSITSFGVFVNLGGPDGLIHRSELSWDRSKKPEDVVTVGQEVAVFIKALDPEKKRISLGYRKDEDNPFVKFVNEYHVDDVVPVKVTSIVAYGAFAEIIPGVEGLIHISNLANKKVEKVADVLKKGQTVDAKIIDINTETAKVSLSVKAVAAEEAADAE